ncbi:MAG TPA: homocysteine S-methyltransferase family protein [Syntrophales bacterium]|nr:homocysteine S-methyltransferase family protein [Syntrophales bacterium]
MNPKRKIINLLNKRVVILDGATGTELQRRLMPAGVCPEVWCLKNPQTIQRVHAAYQNAGSDIIYTGTFGANRIKVSQYGEKNIRDINRRLSLLARSAVGNKVLIAGDISSTGHFVEPFGDLMFEEAVDIFKEQARGLLEGGVDLFVIETMMDIQEARAALIAVKELTDHFTMVTMTFETNGYTLSGTDPVTALITLQSLGADAVGCNCSTGPDAMVNFIAAMKPYATVPLVAKPNAGMPRLKGKDTVFDMGPADFASFGKQFVASGVNLIGGCCGTTPEHIKVLKKEVGNAPVIAPARKSISAVSSARDFKIFDPGSPLFIVGERINPTGKKALQQELLEGKTAIVRQMAKDQEKDGADLLDVNVGVHGIDEIATMRKTLHLLSTSTDLPLVIDSPNVETIKEALRIYPGRALINSISGEKEKIKKLLPIAGKYGAMFILLPITSNEIPEFAARRKEIIKDVYQAARRYGFTKDDIVADGLVMTVASNQQAASEALKTVAWCAKSFKMRTILGLSNVSFGLPGRKWINTAFLAMAASSGLTMAIANPTDRELMSVDMAADVLTGKDQGAAMYIRHFSEQPAIDKAAPSAEKHSPVQRLYEAILEGDREDITNIVEATITSGADPTLLVDDIMIPAMTRVGVLFDQRKYFLPQLMASAEAMKAALGRLEPLIRHETEEAGIGVIILATVKGDIHDIGKNIIALMLRNHGYKIIDLGKDVQAEVIIEAMRKANPDVVGLSALMTTTMVNMKEVIDFAKTEGFSCPFIVGGAVVTKAFAGSIGASYAKDGVEAVRVVEQLVRSKRQEAK